MPPSVCVILPVFRPDPIHLAEQVASLARQRLVGVLVVFVIADGLSAPLVRLTARRAGIAFHVVEPLTRLDTPRAIESGLAAALQIGGPDTLFALADQDDVWHPERLAQGAAALAQSGAMLAHGDARLVDAAGTVLHASMFRFEGRHRRPGLRGLLLRNSVTGMTATFTRKLAALALPFPPQAGVHFYHDLWLALVAQASGGIVRLDEPLVDYRQHGANVMGAIDRRSGPRLRLALPDAGWLRREAASYALARYLAQSVVQRMTEAVAVGILQPEEVNISPLRPFLRRLRGAGTHLADAVGLALAGHLRLARIALGFGVVSLGRMAWSIRQAVGPGLGEALARFDTRLYSLSPGMAPRKGAVRGAAADTRPAPPVRPGTPQPRAPRPVAAIVDIRKEARFQPDFTEAEPRICILVPTLNPTEMFAGVVTAIDIGLGLAAEGLRVAFVATDLPISSREASLHFVTGRLSAAAAARGAGGRASLFCGVTGQRLPAHRDDRFIATAWWSAHVAHRLIRGRGYANPLFHYLLQDYEPNFYPWGPEYADAEASYALPFIPVFNSVPLRDFFADRGYAFARRDSLVFHPAIDIARYAAGRRMPRTGPLRLALYGRPEVARNMFPTAVEALAGFVATEGLRPDQIELLSVGMQHDPVSLGGGHVLHSLGKLPLQDYPDWLLSVDVGLSLMLSPHPSHVPLEMAASGVRVVTNRFASKDLGRLSPAILSVAPEAEAVAEGLRRAARMGPVGHAERCIDLSILGDELDEVTCALARSVRQDPFLAGAAA